MSDKDGRTYGEVLRATLDEQRADILADSMWRHVKTGQHYVVVRVALVEATREPVVVYERDGICWTRPAAEFRERFVFVSPPRAGHDSDCACMRCVPGTEDDHHKRVRCGHGYAIGQCPQGCR